MPMVTKQKRVMCDIRAFEKLLVFIAVWQMDQFFTDGRSRIVFDSPVAEGFLSSIVVMPGFQFHGDEVLEKAPIVALSIRGDIDSG